MVNLCCSLRCPFTVSVPLVSVDDLSVVLIMGSLTVAEVGVLMFLHFLTVAHLNSHAITRHRTAVIDGFISQILNILAFNQLLTVAVEPKVAAVDGLILEGPAFLVQTRRRNSLTNADVTRPHRPIEQAQEDGLQNSIDGTARGEVFKTGQSISPVDRKIHAFDGGAVKFTDLTGLY